MTSTAQAKSTAVAERYGQGEFADAGKKCPRCIQMGTRLSSEVFGVCNWNCYLSRYDDLRQAFGTNHTKAKEHYDNKGKSEGRECGCASDTCVQIFEDGGFKGWSALFAPGYYDSTDMTRHGAKADKMSSLKIIAGCKATLYRDANFSGKEVTLGEGEYDVDELSASGFDNDVLSSMIVTDGPIKKLAACVTVYDGENFEGWSASFEPGEYNVSAMLAKGAYDDQISSIKVGSNCRAILYSHDGFKAGWWAKFNEGYHNSGAFLKTGATSNQASSLRVYAAGAIVRASNINPAFDIKHYDNVTDPVLIISGCASYVYVWALVVSSLFLVL